MTITSWMMPKEATTVEDEVQLAGLAVGVVVEAGTEAELVVVVAGASEEEAEVPYWEVASEAWPCTVAAVAVEARSVVGMACLGELTYLEEWACLKEGAYREEWAFRALQEVEE